MNKDDYMQILKQLRAIAEQLHECSDLGSDWSKAFQIQDMAKEFAKDWEIEE